MNVKEYSKMELGIILKSVPEEEKADQEIVCKDMMQIMRLFVKQGHTPETALYAIGMLLRLMDEKPLSALTGEDTEWIPFGSAGKYEQNKRWPSILRMAGNSAHAFHGVLGYKIEFPYKVPDEPEMFRPRLMDDDRPPLDDPTD